MRENKENVESIEDFNELNQILRDARLTLAEILYRLPDYPDILQTFIWQDRDFAPQYPKLHQFLKFWDHHLEGKIFQVRVAGQKIASAGEFTYAKGQWLLH